jgi:hypothetical protein
MPIGTPTPGLQFARENLLSCMESEVRARNLNRYQFSGGNLPYGLSKACGERLMEKWKSLNSDQMDQPPVFGGDFFGAQWGILIQKIMKRESKSRGTVLGEIFDSFLAGVDGTAKNVVPARENSVASNISEYTPLCSSDWRYQSLIVTNTHETGQDRFGDEQESYDASKDDIWVGVEDPCFFRDAYAVGDYGTPSDG